MTLMGSDRLILFPGMACDERLFAPQRACGLEFEAPAVPIPEVDESLHAYAARVAAELNLNDHPCVLGGVSFGGMLACELASFCNCREVVLIASCRSSAAIPLRNWPVFSIASLLPDVLVSRLIGPSSRLVARMESIQNEHRQLVLDMCRDMPVAVLRRQAAMILGWKHPTEVRCPVRHLHGTKDHMIPIGNVRPDAVVPGGGHFVNMTHPREVAEFISHGTG